MCFGGGVVFGHLTDVILLGAVVIDVSYTTLIVWSDEIASGEISDVL